jgi:putative ABC transport system permease protein
MGYDSRQLKEVIARQVFTFFSIPFLVGLFHSVFAILCYRVSLMQNILDNTPEIYLPVAAAYLATLVIFGVYYFLTLRSCSRIVFKGNFIT